MLANADELGRRPTWSDQPFIEQLNADCCELLDKSMPTKVEPYKRIRITKMANKDDL